MLAIYIFRRVFLIRYIAISLSIYKNILLRDKFNFIDQFICSRCHISAYFIFISLQRKFWNTILASWIVTELINSHWRCGKWLNRACLVWEAGMYIILCLVAIVSVSDFYVPSFLVERGGGNEIFFHWEEIRKIRDNVILLRYIITLYYYVIL